MTAQFCDIVLHHLRQVAPIARRSRFDRCELYRDRILFALIVDEALYFKVDDRTRNDFLTAGLQPMPHNGSDEPTAIAYCQVPPEIVADQAQLTFWMEKAVAAGQRSQRTQKRQQTARRRPPPLAPEG